MRRAAPVALIKVLHLLAITCTLVVLTLSSIGIYLVYKDYVVKSAEQQAIAIGRTVLDRHRDLILEQQPGGREMVAVANREFGPLDEALHAFIRNFSLLKIKIFSADRTLVYSTDRRIVGQRDENNPHLEDALVGIHSSVATTKEAVVDLTNEQRFDVNVVETYVPILSLQGNVIGSFEIYKDITGYRNRIWEGVATSTLILAGILVLAFSISYFIVRTAVRALEKAQRDLRQLADHDSLTGLLTRREIMSRLQEEFSRYQRAGADQPFCLIMLDVDHFKQVNDELGHLVGDQVLKVVAAVVRKHVREYDRCGRYGGEEFLVLLPATRLPDALLLAERVRLAIVQTPLLKERGDLHLSVSLGVSQVRPGDEHTDTVLKRADEGLYRAKHQGRNCIGCVEPGLSAAEDAKGHLNGGN